MVKKNSFNFKANNFFVVIIFVITFVVSNVYIYADENKTILIKENDLYAKSAILIDAESKRVLFEKNGYEQMPMASTTKIMTCLIALEKSNPNDKVVFSKYAVSKPKVKLGASEGSEFYMEDMLYSLMLESHNDTAVAIAETIAGSEENFAKLMNEKAKEMGAFETNFVTANGLDDINHYTTAYDLALITSFALKNEKFIKIINCANHNFSEINGKANYNISNKDAFLTMYKGAIGVKTGFTGKAGYCFVGAAKKNNMTLISVILASGWPPDKSFKWKDTIKLMDYGFNNYNYRTLFNSIDNYKTLIIKDGIEKKVDTYIDGNISSLISDNDIIDYEYIFPDYVEAPVYKNQIIGKVIIKINNEEYQKLNICASDYVKKRDFKYCLNKILDFWMF